MAEKQGETIKVTITFTDKNGTPINMETTPEYTFYKKLKRETIADPTDAAGLYLRSETNPSVGVYDFLINLPRLEDEQSREILQITAFGEDVATVITSNTIDVNIER